MIIIKQNSSTMYIKLYLQMIGHTLNVVTLALQSLRMICIGGTRSSIWYIASPIIKRLFYNKNFSLEKHFCFSIVWQEFSIIIQGPRIKYFNKKSKNIPNIYLCIRKNQNPTKLFLVCKIFWPRKIWWFDCNQFHLPLNLQNVLDIFARDPQKQIIL